MAGWALSVRKQLRRNSKSPGNVDRKPSSMACAALPMATTRIREKARKSSVISPQCSTAPSTRTLRCMTAGISIAASVS